MACLTRTETTIDLEPFTQYISSLGNQFGVTGRIISTLSVNLESYGTNFGDSEALSIARKISPYAASFELIEGAFNGPEEAAEALVAVILATGGAAVILAVLPTLALPATLATAIGVGLTSALSLGAPSVAATIVNLTISLAERIEGGLREMAGIELQPSAVFTSTDAYLNDQADIQQGGLTAIDDLLYTGFARLALQYAGELVQAGQVDADGLVTVESSGVAVVDLADLAAGPGGDACGLEVLETLATQRLALDGDVVAKLAADADLAAFAQTLETGSGVRFVYAEAEPQALTIAGSAEGDLVFGGLEGDAIAAAPATISSSPMPAPTRSTAATATTCCSARTATTTSSTARATTI